MMLNRKIASWTIGTMLLGTGIWCLNLAVKSASFAFSPGGLDGWPVDMRIMAIISSGIAMIFCCLFSFGGGTSISRNKGQQINYYPTLITVTMLIILIVLSVFVRSEYKATSKISWEESRGLPFSFLVLTEIRGVCSGGFAIWKCRSFQSLNLQGFIIDMLAVYVAVCASIQTLFDLSTFNSRQWLSKTNSQIKANGG